jgi:hypothetical protein
MMQASREKMRLFCLPAYCENAGTVFEADWLYTPVTNSAGSQVKRIIANLCGPSGAIRFRYDA